MWAFKTKSGKVKRLRTQLWFIVIMSLSVGWTVLSSILITVLLLKGNVESWNVIWLITGLIALFVGAKFIVDRIDEIIGAHDSDKYFPTE